MALTPIIANIGRRIKTVLYTKDVLKDNKIKREIDEISNHIIVVGFTKVGKIISYILKKSTKNYIIIDNNHRLVRIEKTNGYNICYGDAMNLDILKYIGIERAESIIIAMEDEITCMKITRFINQNFPEVNIVTKSENIKNADRFKKIGANLVISKNVETALQLSKAALRSIGINHNEIELILTNFRDMDSESFKEIINENNQN
jgi:voltage-gated potassium channel Kch